MDGRNIKMLKGDPEIFWLCIGRVWKYYGVTRGGGGEGADIHNLLFKFFSYK